MYTGEWEDGLRSGRGVCIYASGEKFDGLWSCNQPLDHDYSLKATYVVPLHEDEKEGPGERRRRNTGGSELDLDAEEVTPTKELATMSGPASIVYPSGDKYLGQLVGGKRHGRGTYYERSTGNKYEGEWKDDLRHGRGILSSGANDFLYDGEWLDDKRTGSGHCVIRGRESYTGTSFRRGSAKEHLT